MVVYYNEIEPYAAEWLRNLIAEGAIPDGEVDTRSLLDVRPEDVRGFTQCHFFAGVGGWAYALRLAQWPDTRAVWTGSCPCQPFSVAGRGDGVRDERHLWPYWFALIEQCRPRVVFGEQVEAAVKHGWLDLVCADLEGIGYAVAPAVLPAAGVGAPHGRHRLWFVADDDDEGLPPRERQARRGEGQGDEGATVGELRSARGGLADDDSERLARFAGVSRERRPEAGVECDCSARGLADDDDDDEAGRREQRGEELLDGVGSTLRNDTDGRRSSFWSRADWIPCRDGKWRPVEPLPQQMADGLSESMGRLRADHIAEIEKEVAQHAKAAKTDIGEALLDVWLSLGAEALQRKARGLSDVREAPVLLAYLRQLADQGWQVAQSLPRPSSETAEGSLRVLWEQVQATRAPHQRRLDGQPAGEHSDLVRVLSSVLARHAQAAWGEAVNRHVSDAFPLIQGAPNRIGRLRAYGNAIVPQVAAEVIRAYMDIRGCA